MIAKKVKVMLVSYIDYRYGLSSTFNITFKNLFLTTDFMLFSCSSKKEKPTTTPEFKLNNKGNDSSLKQNQPGRM